MIDIPKDRINSLIPHAVEVLQEEGGIASEGRIPDTYHGYISSFSASMVLSSPVVAAIFFEDKEAGKETSRKIPASILRILEKEGTAKPKDKQLLSEYLIAQSDAGKLSHRVAINVLAASIALKLAMRTFKKVKSENDEN